MEHTEECMEDGSNIERNVWRMGRTYRGMCGGWVGRTEECVEDGWNILRNVWRMGGTYRGMYGGWCATSNSKVSCVLSTNGGRARSITSIDSYCHPCF